MAVCETQLLRETRKSKMTNIESSDVIKTLRFVRHNSFEKLELEHQTSIQAKYIQVYIDCMVLTRCSLLLLCIFDSSVVKWWRTLAAGIVLTGRLNDAGNDDDRAMPSWLREKELAWWRSLVSASCWHGVDHIVVVAWRLNGDRMVLAGG